MSKIVRVLAVLPVAVISVVTVILATYTFTRPGFAPAAYLTSPSNITPDPSSICPGDEMTYTVHVRVVSAPASIMIVETVWDVAEHRTAVFDDAPAWAAYTAVTEFDRPFTYRVPLYLTPGAYELRSVAQELGTQPSAFVVPFAIREGC